MLDIRPRQGRTEPTFRQATGTNARRLGLRIGIAAAAAAVLIAVVWIIVAWQSSRSNVNEAPWTPPAASGNQGTQPPDTAAGWDGRTTEAGETFKSFLDKLHSGDRAAAAEMLSRSDFFIGNDPIRPDDETGWQKINTVLGGMSSDQITGVQFVQAKGLIGEFSYTTQSGSRGTFVVQQIPPSGGGTGPVFITQINPG